MEPGPCYGYFPVYYFDACTGTCDRFIYGGCLGNKNKFWTKSQCYNTCVGKVLFLHFLENLQNVCGIKFQLRSLIRFDEMLCFAGNILSVNSSVNLAAACYLPKETGPCRGYFVRYFYNISTGRCQRFAYGGCKGNKNNFKSFGECSKYCVVSKNHFCCWFKSRHRIPGWGQSHVLQRHSTPIYKVWSLCPRSSS